MTSTSLNFGHATLIADRPGADVDDTHPDKGERIARDAQLVAAAQSAGFDWQAPIEVDVAAAEAAGRGAFVTAPHAAFWAAGGPR